MVLRVWLALIVVDLCVRGETVDSPQKALDDFRANREEARIRDIEETARLIALATSDRPAEKYIDAVVGAVETNTTVQEDLLDRIRTRGATAPLFVGCQFLDKVISVGPVHPRDVLTDDELQTYVYQLCYDPTVRTSKEVAVGPFAGWTFEGSCNSISWSFRLAKRKQSWWSWWGM